MRSKLAIKGGKKSVNINRPHMFGHQLQKEQEEQF